MIGKLTGMIDSVFEDHLLLDVHGVGYLVFASARTLRTLQTGQAQTLWIETQLREDSLKLYGFSSPLELQWFTLLQSVQGVGARVALALLTALAPDELAGALARGDKAALGKAPGVGPKLALRLVTELKDKIPAGHALKGLPAHGINMPALDANAQDALSALQSLGYAEAQAKAALTTVMARECSPSDVAALIRASLQELAK